MSQQNFVQFFINKEKKSSSGFTLLEILLVVAMIAILAGIVILAINPGKQLAEARNTQRRADVNTILNAVYQYAIDNNGIVPSSITPDDVEICRNRTDAGATCSGLVDLGVLTSEQKYLTDLPVDPNGTCSWNGICYVIHKSVNNRITVSAPNAELGVSISVTR